MKRTLLAMTIAALTMFGVPGGGPHSAGAQADPEGVIRQLMDALDRGDTDTAVELYTDDAILEDIDGGSLAVVGRAALRLFYGQTGALNARVSIVRAEVSGSAVTGLAELVDDTVRQAGVERVLRPFTAEVADGQVSALRLTYDRSDPQTSAYLAYQESQLESGGEALLPEDAVSIDLRSDGNTNVLGAAHIGSADGLTGLSIDMTPGPEDVLQPAHIRHGSCGSLDDSAYPLASVLNGQSFTLVSVSLSELLAGGYAIDVQASEAESGVSVACGDILVPGETESSPPAGLPPPAEPQAPPAVEAPEVEAPAESQVAPAVAPPGVEAPAQATGPLAGSGGFLGSDESSLPRWWYAMAALGALLAVTGFAGLRRFQPAISPGEAPMPLEVVLPEDGTPVREEALGVPTWRYAAAGAVAVLLVGGLAVLRAFRSPAESR